MASVATLHLGLHAVFEIRRTRSGAAGICRPGAKGIATASWRSEMRTDDGPNWPRCPGAGPAAAEAAQRRIAARKPGQRLAHRQRRGHHLRRRAGPAASPQTGPSPATRQRSSACSTGDRSLKSVFPPTTDSQSKARGQRTAQGARSRPRRAASLQRRGASRPCLLARCYPSRAPRTKAREKQRLANHDALQSHQDRRERRAS